MSVKLLIVDDDPVVSEIVGEISTALGYEAKACKSASELLNLVAGATYRPDIIFLDVMLGSESGPSVLAKVRENTSWKGIPVILMSANSMEEIVILHDVQQTQGFLQKPFRAEDVSTAIKSVQKKTS